MPDDEKNNMGKIFNDDMNKSFTHDRPRPNTEPPKPRRINPLKPIISQIQLPEDNAEEDNNEPAKAGDSE